jgi:hypothetical protein
MRYQVEFQVLTLDPRFQWVNRTRRIEASSPDVAWKLVENEFAGSSIIMYRITQLPDVTPKQKLSDILASVPDDVAACIRTLMSIHGTRKVRFVMQPADSKLYLAEDYEYHFFLNGEKKSVSMDGEWNGYTRTAGRHVNEDLPVPQGAYVVAWFWYGNLITVKHWGLKVIEAKNE